MKIKNDGVAEIEHEVRQLVDNYRSDGVDDREIALVLDAIRGELELGNYEEAHVG